MSTKGLNIWHHDMGQIIRKGLFVIGLLCVILQTSGYNSLPFHLPINNSGPDAEFYNRLTYSHPIKDQRQSKPISTQQGYETNHAASAFNCPGNQSKAVNTNCAYITNGAEFDPTGTTAPGEVILNNLNNGATLAGYIFPLGETTVTWKVSRIDGTVHDYCSFAVLVTDTKQFDNCPATTVVFFY
jgi:hypothetical protein